MTYFSGKLCALLLIGLLMQGCRQRSDSPVVPDNSLVITGVSIPEAPTALVEINQALREISIAIPTANSPARITPVYKTVCTDCVVSSQRIELCNDQLPIQRTAAVGRKNPTETPLQYRVLVKAIGTANLIPLLISTNNAALTAEIGTPASFLATIQNNFDGATTRFIFTNTTTGQTFESALSCYESSTAIGANQVTVPIPAASPGVYTVDAVKANGRRGRLNQQITLTKGLPQTGFDDYNPPIVGNQLLALRGANLFGSDNLELQIKTRSGKTYRLPTQNHAANGTTAQLVVPADIEPGDYIAQFFRNNQPVASYTRLTFLADSRQPAFVGFYKAIDIPNGPLILQKGKIQPYIFVLRSVDYSQFKTARIKLVQVNGSGDPILFDTPVADSFLRYGPDGGGGPTFTIPPTMADGRYRLYLQYVNRDGSIRESEPFAVDAEVSR